jgi:hypothetical protein
MVMMMGEEAKKGRTRSQVVFGTLMVVVKF